MNQSHGSSAFREPANAGAVPTVLLGRLVNAPVVMAFEWNYGDPLPFGLVFTGDANRTKLDASGVPHPVAANVPRNDGYVYDKNGLLVPGWLLEGSRKNSFLNSGAPASHTSPSLSTGTYTLWLVGTGSIAVAAGTATITGAGTATAASSVTFTVTVAGTVTFTVTGSPTRAQCENGPLPSSYIPTTSAAVTRADESASVPWPWSPRAMTGYLKGVNLGVAQDSAISMRLLTIGGGGNPRFIMASAGSSKLRGIVLNSLGASATDGPTQTIAFGDAFEARFAYAADGTTVFGVSDAGAAESTAPGSAVAIIDGAWSSPSNAYLGTSPTGGPQAAMMAFQSIRIALDGPWSLDQMRKVAPDTTAHTFDITGAPTGSLVPDGVGGYDLTVGDFSGLGPAVIGTTAVIY